jgi:hypothetical protein
MIDFPLNLSDRKEYWTWFEGRQWLSLDRFERFWTDVGLALENGEAVKYAVRAELRAKYAKDAEEGDDLEYMDFLETLAKTCFRTINEMAGPKDAERIAIWLTGPVLAANRESWSHRVWSILLYRLGDDDPHALATHGIPSDTARKIIEIAALFRSKDDANEERIEAADLEPLVGWDAVVYEVIRQETPEGSPFVGLSLLLRYLAFERAWEEVVRCTPPTYIEALIRWGRANIGPEDELYEHVTIPDDIRAAWHQAWRN